MQRAMKADFHAHSGDDPRDSLCYSTEMLIDEAAEHGIEVLAITLHEWMECSPRLSRYADRKGVLLIPAIEQNVEGNHLLMLNPDREQAGATTFADLRALGRRDAAFIAPHPFYPLGSCLGRALSVNIDLFDAIEYCTLYGRGINWPNWLAARAARRHGLPLVGTSDTHTLPYVSSTHTLVTAEKTVDGVIEAIRQGRVELVTAPRPWPALFRLVAGLSAGIAWDIIRSVWNNRFRLRPTATRTYAPGDLHPAFAPVPTPTSTATAS